MAETETRLDGIEGMLKETAQLLRQIAQEQARFAQEQEQVHKQIAQETAESTSRVKQLQEETAELRKQTAQELAEVTRGIKQLQQTVGSLVHDRSFSLEAMAALWLPSHMKAEHGIETNGFARRYFPAGGNRVTEVNLYADGKKNGRKAIGVLVECKSEIGAGSVRQFARKAARISRALGIPTFKIMLGYAVHPDAKILARKESIAIVSPVPHVL